jgi:prepilin-type N-terminal cleavage/methylation domain-containing protein
VKIRGFTLIEFVIAMAVIAALAVMVMFLYAPADNYALTQSRRLGFSEGSAALSRMMKEIRTMKDVNQIQTMTADHIRFLDSASQWVEIQKSGTNLMLDTDVLARSVTGLTFTYLDEDGNVTATKQDVRVVNILLVINSRGQTINLESAARIRNP